MHSNYKQVIKKYYISCAILGVILISLWILYSLYSDSPFGMILFLIVELIIVRISITIIVKKTLLPVLYENLNAIEFQKIVDNKHFVAPLIFRATAAVASGDYQTAINIASVQVVNSNSHLRRKYYYLSLLARIYFELRDFDKLKLLLNKYDELRVIHPSKKLFNTSKSTWDFYRFFLEHDFETCKIICEKKDKISKGKVYNRCSRYDTLINNFYYAVTCYSDGNLETALQIFKEIINMAPKMHLADVSQKYIESINTSSKMTVLKELVPQENYQLYDDRTSKKFQRHKIITTILFTLICVAIIAPEVIDFVINEKQNQFDAENHSTIVEFEKDLNNAIAMNYDNANFITYFNVTDGTQHIDSFCLVEHDDRLDLASIVTHDDGESLNLIILIEDIQIPNDYSVKSTGNSKQINLYITNVQLQSSKGKELFEFSFNKQNYWIEIQSITHLT